MKVNTAQLAPLGTRRRVAILAVSPVDAMDVIGPAEVFSLANYLRTGQPAFYQIDLVSAGKTRQIQSESGIALVAHSTLQQEMQTGSRIDTLIVAGGYSEVGRYGKDLVAWIAENKSKFRRLCSICVGAFVLAKAGILNDKRATTHWKFASKLAHDYPEIHVDPDPLWIRQGHIYTSAGISAGIDLALELVAEDLGEKHALGVAKCMVLFVRRSGGQAQFSESLRAQAPSNRGLRNLQAWIAEHLGSDLSVTALADKAAMSPRNLVRVFKKELDTSPSKYVESIRLEAARREIEMATRSMDQIAARCGFQSVDVMRRAFTRTLGITPRQYADRFKLGSRER